MAEYSNPDIKKEQNLNNQLRSSYEEKAPQLHMPRFQANYRPSIDVRKKIVHDRTSEVPFGGSRTAFSKPNDDAL